MRALRTLPIQRFAVVNARLGRIMLDSRANGPGLRDVYWFVGCSIRCPGCTNPQFLQADQGLDVALESIQQLMAERAPHIEGITLSGGEPTEQVAAALNLARHARSLGLGIVLFTGRTPRALEAYAELRDACDLIVAGPYRAARPSQAVLLGSSNQKVLFVTGRYSTRDLEGIARVEWQLRGAKILVTGVG